MKSDKKILSYEKAGVNIDNADSTKRDIASILMTGEKRVLNQVGAFASLYDGYFPEYKHPILVLKTEEPGSKQKIAFHHGRIESICSDMINHLVNDITVMGAKPHAVQDLIVCGKLIKQDINRIVKAIADACRENECVLTGGETTEQPGVVEDGVYILASSIVGVVEKDKIIDGKTIETDDMVIAVASNGIHTNGYSLVRLLMKEYPEIINQAIEGERFLDIILKPHKAYYKAFKPIVEKRLVKGMAHITGGGIQGNLNRILPKNCDALVDLSKVNVLPIFKFIRDRGNVTEADMLKTFNMGVGMALVADETNTDAVIKILNQQNCTAYKIGKIILGSGDVVFDNHIKW